MFLSRERFGVCSSFLIIFIGFSKSAALETEVERHLEKKSVINSVFWGIIYQLKQSNIIKFIDGTLMDNGQ